jgi:hypothetical protein
MKILELEVVSSSVIRTQSNTAQDMKSVASRWAKNLATWFLRMTGSLILGQTMVTGFKIDRLIRANSWEVERLFQSHTPLPIPAAALTSRQALSSLPSQNFSPFRLGLPTYDGGQTSRAIFEEGEIGGNLFCTPPPSLTHTHT